MTPRLSASRRTFLAQAAAAACALSAQRLFALQPVASTIVRTPAGTLLGEDVEGVRVFRGIPYAAPPIGPLRFRPPQESAPWPGERDATRFSASPMQSGEPGVPHSEDCLYLNIWAPETSKSCPVFVWIHGGGFTGGHAFEPMYDGAAFARNGIVCVTVEYRLGVFGFLDLEPLLGAQYAGSANNGLRDLIAALAWVQQNIAAFGGDPSHVTIGGESAGAKLIDIMMGIPAAQPLFQQAISESGGAERVWPQSNAALVAEGFAKTWNAASGGGKLESLQTAPAATLIEAQQTFVAQWPQHFPLRPELGGALLPRLPIETIAAGSTRGKRLLIGTNREESALFIGPHPAANATAADLGNLKLADFLTVFSRYKSLYPHLSDEQLRIRALTAEEYWIPSVRVADAHLQGGGSAWMYRLDFAESSGRLEGYAYHSLDVGLVWSKPHADVRNASDEAILSRQIHAAWSAFIRSGTPAAPGLPAWPQYRPDLRSTMILNTESRIEQQPQAAELHLWDGLL